MEYIVYSQWFRYAHPRFYILNSTYMDKLLQENGMDAAWLLLSGQEQKSVGDDVRKALEWELKHKNQMILGFFRGLDEYVVHPRYIDYIIRHQLTRDPEFRLALEAKLITILQSPTILSDDGCDLQHFLLELATYEELFHEVKLSPTTVEALKNRLDFLRINGQSDGIINRLSQFLPKH